MQYYLLGGSHNSKNSSIIPILFNHAPYSTKPHASLITLSGNVYDGTLFSSNIYIVKDFLFFVVIHLGKTKRVNISVEIPFWIDEKFLKLLIRAIIDVYARLAPPRLSADEARVLFGVGIEHDIINVREFERERIKWLYSILQQQ